MGITLWLVPPEEDAKRLKSIMETTRHTERPNLPSSYPNFHPHVTLASFPSASISTQDFHGAIVSLVHSKNYDFAVKFKSIDVGTHFFRSVYIAVNPTPSLLDLHRDVHDKLGMDPRTPSFPHVSLCYIDDQDADRGERDNFLQELKDQGKIRYAVSEKGEEYVSIRCGHEESEQDGAGWLNEFEVKEVWIAQCDGPVESWKILDKISIS